MKKIILLLLSVFSSVVPGLSAYVPKSGVASWYGLKHQGLTMANGEPFDANRLTCASWFYPLGTKLQVMNSKTHRSIRVVVTDRGPARHLVANGRIIDLSFAAFAKIGDLNAGLIPVQVRIWP